MFIGLENQFDCNEKRFNDQTSKAHTSAEDYCLAFDFN